MYKVLHRAVMGIPNSIAVEAPFCFLPLFDSSPTSTQSVQFIDLLFQHNQYQHDNCYPVNAVESQLPGGGCSDTKQPFFSVVNLKRVEDQAAVYQRAHATEHLLRPTARCEQVLYKDHSHSRDGCSGLRAFPGKGNRSGRPPVSSWLECQPLRNMADVISGNKDDRTWGQLV